MKKIFFLILTIITGLGSIITLSSCSSDEDFDTTTITGTWYGTRTYHNPASGTKYQYLTITFEDNGTGSLEYEAPTSYSAAKFTYSIKNDIITCNGAYANTDGVVEDDFKMTLKIEGDRLIPLDRYNVFILTRDNSVITDSDGNEVIDNRELLYGVWLHSSGNVVLVLDKSEFTEYTLPSPSSKIYSSKTEGSFYYNYESKYVLINGSRYDVTALSETTLQLKSEKNVYFNYTRGDASDIPSDGGDSADYKSILENASMGWSTSSNDIIIRFYDTNRIFYLETSSKHRGTNLEARGKYTLSGKNIVCEFDDVFWDGGNSYAKDDFPGWTHNQPCTKTFTIVSLNVDCLILEREGKRYYLYNVLS